MLNAVMELKVESRCSFELDNRNGVTYVYMRTPGSTTILKGRVERNGRFYDWSVFDFGGRKIKDGRTPTYTSAVEQVKEW